MNDKIGTDRFSGSEKLLAAFDQALERERVPLARRIGIGLLAALAICLFSGLFVARYSVGTVPLSFHCLTVFWSLVAGMGVFLYRSPSPRLLTEAFLPSWVMGLFLLLNVASFGVILFVCPSLTFLPMELPWKPLDHFTHMLMERGGMNLCMLFCGALVAFVPNFVALSVIRKSFKRGPVKDKALLSALAVTPHLGLLAYYLSNQSLRDFSIHWVGGAVIGVVAAFLAAITVRKAVR